MRRGVAAIGLCSWDRFLVVGHYPQPGEYAIVEQRIEQAGGTTGNTCDALARIGIAVMLVSAVGDDAEGAALIESLRASGCDVAHVTSRAGSRSDSGVIVVSGVAGQRDRTIYWMQGAHPRHGDPLPVNTMLNHEWVLVDVADARLRSFILDLPAHRSPRTKLFGTMTYLAEMAPDAGWQHALRCDAMAGNMRELMSLCRTTTVDAAIDIARRDMQASACRVMFVTRGRDGALAIRPDGVTLEAALDIDVVDTTGAGDAFVAGCLWGLLDRCDDREILTRANVLGGLACRALGARAALPSRAEIERALATIGGRT